jgi:hypothetical protein
MSAIAMAGKSDESVRSAGKDSTLTAVSMIDAARSADFRATF